MTQKTVEETELDAGGKRRVQHFFGTAILHRTHIKQKKAKLREA